MKTTLDAIQSNLNSERGFDQLLEVDGNHITSVFKTVIVPAVEDFKLRIKQGLDGGDNYFNDFNHWLLSLNGGPTAKKYGISFRLDSHAPLYEFTELLKERNDIADEFFETLNPELEGIGYRVALDDAENSVKNVKAIRAVKQVSNIDSPPSFSKDNYVGLGYANIENHMSDYENGYSTTWASEEILLPQNLQKLTFDGVYKGMGFTQAECRNIYNHFLSVIKPQLEKEEEKETRR